MFDAGAFARLLESASAQTLLVIDEAYWEYARLAWPVGTSALAQARGHKRVGTHRG